MWMLALAAVVGARDPVAAERAFAAAAQKEGQWTAFRRFASDAATLFTPQPTVAREWLKDRADPARSIAWSPTASFRSCDGQMAANTGEWRRPDGSTGYFSTIWLRQADGGWRWDVDGGGPLATPRAPVKRPVERVAACKGDRPTPPVPYPDGPESTGAGLSADRTLLWSYRVQGDGARVFTVELWNGAGYDTVIDDHVAAPPPPQPPAG